MPTVELNLDEPTLERARRLAEARNLTVEEVVKEALERLPQEEVRANPILGMFSDIPDIMDEITEDAMKSRESRVFRSE